ncbi:MAG: hypothetical protein N3F64_02390 [Nitrososphaeria archaeon]|nr:hypothetical protein [Nitrososphaeria archaeon]
MRFFGSREKASFDELLFLEKISKKMVEGVSLERAIFEVLKETNFKPFKNRLTWLIRGEDSKKVLRNLPFETSLPKYVSDINKIRSMFAGKVLDEIVNIILLNRRCQKERIILLDILYHRSIIVTLLLGITLSFLSQMAPLFSIIIEFTPKIQIDYSIRNGIIYFSFILGIFSTFLQNLLFGKKRTLITIIVYIISYYIGLKLSKPILNILP